MNVFYLSLEGNEMLRETPSTFDTCATKKTCLPCTATVARLVARLFADDDARHTTIQALHELKSSVRMRLLHELAHAAVHAHRVAESQRGSSQDS